MYLNRNIKTTVDVFGKNILINHSFVKMTKISLLLLQQIINMKSIFEKKKRIQSEKVKVLF